MRAARFDAKSRALTVRDVPEPQPGPGEVLVRVAAAGICASDLHMLDGEFAPPVKEVTPGHETAGTIEALGAGVPYWEPGVRVTIIPGPRGCGQCRQCRTGQDARCPNYSILGQGYDGGWAEYVVVPHQCLLAVPDRMPLQEAAVLVDAVATPYTALVNTGHLRLGETVALWGIGGLGTHAVQHARLAGACLLIAVDPVPAARRRALELGADHVFDPTADDVRAEVLRLTDGDGVDLAVDLSGVNSALDQAVSCLAAKGRAVVVGMSSAPIHLSESTVLFGYYNHALFGHDGYDRTDLERLMRLVVSGRLDLSRSVSHVVPLEDVASGVERLRSKEGNPVRIVVEP